MLKGIPGILSPELLKVMMEMGHGDEIVLADGNFPGASHAAQLIRCDGCNVPEILEAMLNFFPLDTGACSPAALMDIPQGYEPRPPIWSRYREIITASEDQFSDFEYVERFDFYQRAKKAFAIVTTREKALYANIILKKGVVTEQ